MGYREYLAYLASEDTCRRCGKAIPPERRSGSVFYCCRECQRIANGGREESGPRSCDHCGESYQPKRSDSRFCSPKCRVYANRQAKKENQ